MRKNHVLFFAVLVPLLSILSCNTSYCPSCFGAERPNILWLTSEDNGPHLGCYGDDYATTPHLDALAARGLIYTRAVSNAPVCAPARTTIISGLYPPATGSEHMRTMTRLPEGFRMYPQYLRNAGYYCTNNSKEDYNLAKPGQVWDESSGKAHWKNRRPDQPFFAVFNFTISHESRIRSRPHKAVHDPAQVRVPAYHPDTPEVRQDWAQYYDRLTEMDVLVGKALKEVEDAGLADDTIVFYYGDHGSGMPRSKRWPYFSGINVPLIVHVPEKWKHLAAKEYEPGGKTDRRVGFIDLAPTVLSLAGIEPPEHFQGHAFLGKHALPPQPYAFGFRGRMDERYDLVRSVVGERYIYIRNYMPHKIYGQHVAYMFQTPTTRVWKRRYDAGKLNEAQSRFWQEKPTEELYDLVNDPDEVNNLAGSKEHQSILAEMRKAHEQWERRIRDVSFLPEPEIHERAGDDSPYDLGRDPERYPFDQVFRAASLASSRDEGAISELRAMLGHDDSAVRYWGATGLLILGGDAVREAADDLRRSLGDRAPSVQVAAAEALGSYGSEADLSKSLDVLLEYGNVQQHGVHRAMLALNGLDALDERAAERKQAIAKLPQKAKGVNGRVAANVPNLIRKILADLE